ncbi:UbiA family prenyltransferase [Nocardioides sp. C4-1]|uniref:UbiA family prenyltransferase n=1 Tax=Nocardioides sp. C4-1 TaxID=3151851 RepID=UPI0032675710
MAKLQRWRRRDQGPAEPLEPGSDVVPDDSSDGADDGVAEGSDEGADGVSGPASATATATATTTAVAVEPPARGTSNRLARSILDSQVVALLLAAHPRQALTTGVGLGLVALAAGRPVREAAVVAATALVGQAILGWHNDIVDRERDRRHRTARKPVSDGRLEPGTVWYALVLALLLVVPLSVSTGVTAGTFYLGALAVGLVGNVVLRRGKLSFLPWMAQFALYAPYLSYGGWGGGGDGDPPEPAMVALFALVGLGVHVLRAIWGLVADDADGWTYLPLVLGRKVGATRLLVLVLVYLGVVVAVMVVVGRSVGLRA